MNDFFDKLSKLMSFETQVYVFIGVLLVLLLLCFILLIVVGSKCKKLARRVEKLEDSMGLGESEEETEEPEADEDLESDAEDANAPETVEISSEENGAEDAPEVEEETFEQEEAQEAPEGTVVGEAVLLGEQKIFNETVENEINALKEKTDILTKNQRKSFDKIKVVRYSSNLPDGTETTGYSIGITNQDNDGIVLTGTEQQDGGTMLIVKSVKGGVSKVPLTPAEDCAVQRTAK